MKYRFCFLLGLMIFSLSSCEKILEKEPLDFMVEEVYYDTPEKLEANVLGIYDILQDGALYSSQMLYMGGLEADEGYYARESSVDGPQTYFFSAGNSRVNNFWTSLYSGIGRANALIANVDVNPEIPQATRDKIRAEALFLRGYYYFMLVQTFGGVPLILEPVKDVNDVDIPRATAKEVYDQILMDMEKALPFVPGIRELGFGGRVSKSAVRGILARVCLHMAGFPVRDVSKYAEARKWAKEVIDDTEANHSLNPSFSQVFINYAQDKYDVNESIWEVEFSGNRQQGAYAETGGVGYLNGPSTSNATVGNSFGGVKVTANLYNAYVAGDLRRDWTIARFEYNDKTGAYVYITSTTPIYKYVRDAAKFRREYETLEPKHRTQTPQNFPLLRFSDVLLMFAEADFEVVNQGTGEGVPSDEAIAAVEKVKERAMSKGGIRAFGVGSRGSGYSASNPPEVSIEPPTGGTPASLSVTVASNGTLNTPTVDPDPVTGFKMGSGYTGTPRIIITPRLGNAYFTIRTYIDLHKLTTAEKDNFRKTIQDERFRELAFETLRKHDLIRWGILVYEMKQVANDVLLNAPDRYYLRSFANAQEKHNLWPIPAREMNLNNKLVQNPGW